MGLFDSVCHTFTTLATGGFSTRNASIAAYQSTTINLIIVFFMVAGGVNFALYYQALRGRVRQVFRDTELRLYLALLLIGVAAITLMVRSHSITMVSGEVVRPSTVRALEHVLFDVTSLATTTGFATAEYDEWPVAAKAIVVILILIGGSAGSTSGGIKVVRFWIVLKLIAAEIEREFRPNVVRPTKIGAGAAMTPEQRLGALAFVLAFLMVLAVCTAALMVIENVAGNGIDLTSAASGTLACMCTTGPGLGLLGGAENYGWLTPASQAVLTLAMIAGRLEIFTILVLFLPRFWRGT